ncbi:hypothetical protein [Sphingomonas rubra]|uniref:Lipoprotein n=1 Tax=Sphingomonas rubra TaxID=634430 RepID=A0A1I5QKU9_9SPHN|nr:hypothetical protein [Sphingomonas rubra]SFP46845.1 hypothetical protein SAMN04488241_102123 [Sphingomonas rubra]
MRVLPVLSVLLVLAAVTGCIPQRPAPPPTVAAPPVIVAAPPPAPPAADWRDRPFTPGTWTYRQDARGSIALFGQAGQDAAATLRCDRGARLLYLSRTGSVAAPLTIRTTSTTRTAAVQPTGGTPPYVALALAARDPLLDAMAFSRGRFTLEQAGTRPLVLPAWAEIGRVIEDCRA